MTWALEALPFVIGGCIGLLESHRAAAIPGGYRIFAVAVGGVLCAAGAGELRDASAPLAVLVDSCGLGAGWLFVKLCKKGAVRESRTAPLAEQQESDLTGASGPSSSGGHTSGVLPNAHL